MAKKVPPASGTSSGSLSRRPRNEWSLLLAKHRGHRHLRRQQLLTLPLDVVNAIASALPKFFREEDLAFERDLARTARLGFFRKSLIEGGGRITPPYYLLGPPPDEDSEESVHKRAKQDPHAAGRLAPELYEEWSDEERARLTMFEGRPVQRDGDKSTKTWRLERWEIREEERRRFRQRCEGFVVWLVTNRHYLADRDELRDQYWEEVEQQQCFPRRRPVRRAARGGWRPPDGFMSAESPSLSREFPQNMVVAFDEFYKRWSLDTLLTWDLPLPHNFDAEMIWTPSDGEGFHVFVPWHLLRDGMIDLNKVIRRYRRDLCPRNLGPWFDAKGRRAKHLGGELGLSRQFQLYWCLHLVLADRYADVLEGKLEALDPVFAPLLGNRKDGTPLSAATVSKLRKNLSRDLAEARDPKTSFHPQHLEREWILAAPDPVPFVQEVDDSDAGEEPPPMPSLPRNLAPRARRR